MIDYVEMAKEVVKALEENKKLFSDFVSNYSEITLLDTTIREGIANIIDEAGISKTCYSFFGTEYDTFVIYCSTMNKCYINDFDIFDYSLFLISDSGEDRAWIPIIFIKEFWDFYFDYISKKRENEKMVCSLKLREGLKQNEKQNEVNIDDICKTIAEDFIENYDSYTDIFNALDSFSNISVDDSIELFANFLKRLF